MRAFTLQHVTTLGIIQRQTLQATAFAYVGVVIGFVTNALLIPYAFDPDTQEGLAQNGLLSLLVKISVILTQLSTLGFANATYRFFPYFRDPENRHNGVLPLTLAVTLGGYLLCMAGLLALKPWVIERNVEKSPLLVEYFLVLVPLTFFQLSFNVLDNYARALYDTVTGTFLKEFVQRLLLLFSVLAYWLGWVSFGPFLVLWTLGFAVPTVLIWAKVYRDGTLHLRPRWRYPEVGLARRVRGYALFAIVTGFTTMIVQFIDSLMVNDYLGLADVGIYGTAMLFGTVVSMPSRGLYRIANTSITQAWKDDDRGTIETIYRKSCLNLLAIGSLVFIGIWANLHNVLQILPPAYAAGYWVIVFFGLGNLFDMATGTNGIILATSPKYRVDLLFYALLVVLTIALNALLIPRFGITGSAAATATTLLLFNAFRTVYVGVVFRLWPFDWRNAAVAALAAGVLAASFLLPRLPLLVDLPLRSGLITAVFGGTLYALRLSPDVNRLVDSIWERVKRGAH
jgi:O-antigen/teichoic acid export membrane protein